MTHPENKNPSHVYVNVLLAVPFFHPFSYLIPLELQSQWPEVGARVLVPFGKRQAVGIIESYPATISETTKLKPIIRWLDEQPLITKIYFKWLSEAARYYMAPQGLVFGMAFPAGLLNPVTDTLPKRRTLVAKMQMPEQIGLSVLTDEQQTVLHDILPRFNSFYPVLIQGVTGSGKSEIYLHLIHYAIQQKKSVLVLVPEVALSEPMMQKISQWFQTHVFHSHVSPVKKQKIWKLASNSSAQVFVGTRSALFLPIQNLGLIVVDEEHDASYKQEERFRYQARDLALMRAQYEKIPIVLGSATPSLESMYQVINKKYKLHVLTERFGLAKPARILLVDALKTKQQKSDVILLTTSIHEAIKKCYNSRQQIIVFVGQRGFSQNALCTACQNVVMCPDCSVGLKFHKAKNILLCHYCGFQKPFKWECSICFKNQVTLVGFGIEAVYDELRVMHPQMILGRLDSDTTTTVKKQTHVLKNFENKTINVLVGTQMVTKGHDFSNVGLVVVVGCDTQMGLPDFRSNERVYQTILQVAGRAGRRGGQALVLVQSYLGANQIMQMATQNHFDVFLKQELNSRHELFYPPYSRLVQVRFVAKSESRLQKHCSAFKQKLKEPLTLLSASEVCVLGPVEMPVYKMRGEYRQHVLFKFKRGLVFQPWLKQILELESANKSGVRVLVDVDSTGLL